MVDTVNANSLKRCRNKKKIKKLEQASKILGKESAGKVNTLSAKLTKWPNTRKQFVGKLSVWPFCGIGA